MLGLDPGLVLFLAGGLLVIGLILALAGLASGDLFGDEGE